MAVRDDNWNYCVLLAEVDRVERASDPHPAFVQYVRVDHGGLYAAVAEELLDRADVVTVFQEMGGEGMTEGV